MAALDAILHPFPPDGAAKADLSEILNVPEAERYSYANDAYLQAGTPTASLRSRKLQMACTSTLKHVGLFTAIC